MNFIAISREEGIATVSMGRGKVNAMNEALIDELDLAFRGLAEDRAVRAVILTGSGKFFSFGFDIPEFLASPRGDFTRFLGKFCAAYARIFRFPKPVIGAINGHATAGGCVLALACDLRIMVAGKARIALNELNIGVPIFAGCVGMLQCAVGSRNAERVLLTGALYSAEEAHLMGLVDQVAAAGTLMADAKAAACELARKEPEAFRALKDLLRGPLTEDFLKREEESIRAFIEIWYSAPTQEILKGVVIRT